MSSEQSTQHVAGNGGAPARRAVVHWAVRMFRREWRQQIMVVALLTVAVAAAVGFSAAAYTMAPVPGNADFGTATRFLKLESTDPQVLATDVHAAKEWFGTIDVIGHRTVPVPGRFEQVEYRTQDPEGAYGGPMLDVLEGSFPGGAGEIAVTDALADSFELDLGDTFDVDGTDRTVVGVVENPSDLSDEFALTPPGFDPAPESVTILIDSSTERFLSFRPQSEGDVQGGSREGFDESVIAVVLVLGVATVALLLIALLAAAGFVVIAHRRLRQVGMVAAIGATEKHVRLMMVANGAVIGGVAAVAGAAFGLLGWIAAEPRLESALGFRVDRFDVPWWLVAIGMALAVVTATVAAWWPARAVARTSIVGALSGRPTRSRPVHRSASVAGLLIAAGVVSLVVAGDPGGDASVRWGNVVLVAGGTVAIVAGVLFCSPLAIRALAAIASRLPVAPRLAVRDLVRYQARSGAALAAISLALGIGVTIIVGVSAVEATAQTGNLSDRQLLIRTGDLDGPYVPESAEVGDLQAQVDRIAGALDDPTVTALNVALDPTLEPEPGSQGRLAVSLGRRAGDVWEELSLVYVATPALLEDHGVDLDTVRSDTEVMTTETGGLVLLGVAIEPGAKGRDPQAPKVQVLPPGYSSLPGSFITSDVLQDRGWEAVPSGQWLLETSNPLTPDQLSTARELAATGGLTIESRDQQGGLKGLRSGATAVGLLLALGILALTVGLIRSEAASDLRTLTATGATSATRRSLIASTAGSLAALGVILGTAGALTVLIAGYLSDVGGTLSRVPILHLLVLAIGTPIAAASAGWLLAGREPPALTRQPIG
jgi:putative ABC transport system permease protein